MVNDSNVHQIYPINVTLNNVTVASNSSNDSQGWGLDFGVGTYLLKNSIVADNGVLIFVLCLVIFKK